jgi:hypothetical protein
VRLPADPRIARVRRLLEILERALGQPLLLGGVAGRPGLLELGGAAIEGEPVLVDLAAPRRAIVGIEGVVVAPVGVGAVAGLDVGIGGAERLPAAERDDQRRERRAPRPARRASAAAMSWCLRIAGGAR